MTSRDLIAFNRKVEILFRSTTLGEQPNVIARAMRLSRQWVNDALIKARADTRIVKAAQMMADHRKEKDDESFR